MKTVISAITLGLVGLFLSGCAGTTDVSQNSRYQADTDYVTGAVYRTKRILYMRIPNPTDVEGYRFTDLTKGFEEYEDIVEPGTRFRVAQILKWTDGKIGSVVVGGVILDGKHAGQKANMTPFDTAAFEARIHEVGRKPGEGVTWKYNSSYYYVPIRQPEIFERVDGGSSS